MSRASCSFKHEDLINVNVLGELIIKAVIGILEGAWIESLSPQFALPLVFVVVASDHLLHGVLRRVKEHASAIVFELFWSYDVFLSFFVSQAFFLVILIKETTINFLVKLNLELVKICLVNDIVSCMWVETVIALATYQVLIRKRLLEVSNLLFENSIFTA